MSQRVIEIQGKQIGRGHPAYIIAEMSANHCQDFNHAVEILKAAHAVGADAVKLQTYTADTLTIESDAPPFTIQGGLWGGRRLHELYLEAYTPWLPSEMSSTLRKKFCRSKSYLGH